MKGIPNTERQRLGALLDHETQETVMAMIPQFSETEIGAPVSVTGAPRTRPSVGFSAIVRTRLSPRCWATSSVIVKVDSPSP